MKAKDKNTIYIFASFVFVYVICLLFGNWQVSGSLRVFSEFWIGLGLTAVAGYRIYEIMTEREMQKKKDETRKIIENLNKAE